MVRVLIDILSRHVNSRSSRPYHNDCASIEVLDVHMRDFHMRPPGAVDWEFVHNAGERVCLQACGPAGLRAGEPAGRRAGQRFGIVHLFRFSADHLLTIRFAARSLSICQSSRLDSIRCL